MSRCKPTIVYWTFPIIFLIIFLLFFSISNPLWFTNDQKYIDAWIYWGAGDNPQLSFQNDFARTYYLQRYVVILPQIISYFIFGSFWGQLTNACFWIFTTYIFLVKTASRFLPKTMSTILVIFLFSNTLLMNIFGSSYTMAPTIALYSAFFFCLTSISRNLESSNTCKYPILTGLAIALLLNTYLTHGIFAVVLAFAYLIRYRSKISWKIPFRMLLAATIVTLFFQIIYFTVSGDLRPFLINQLRFGTSLATKPNPWNTQGIFDFLTQVYQDQIYSYWWISILVFIVSIILIKLRSKSLIEQHQELILVTALLVGLYISLSFFNVNVIGYAWIACGLVIVKFNSLILMAEAIRGLLKDHTINVILLTSIIFILIMNEYFSKFDSNLFSLFKPLDAIFVFLGSSSMLTLGIFLNKSVNRFFVILPMIVAINSLSIHDNSPLFANYSTHYEGNFNQAKAFYQKLSLERSTILRVSKEAGANSRSWFVPEGKLTLASTQLYMYSLISNEFGKENCAQVDWASNFNSLLFSFAKEIKDDSINTMYFHDCGYKIHPLRLTNTTQKLMNTIDGRVWVIRPNN